MLNISGIISKFIKNSSQREIDRLKSIVQKTNEWESKIKDIPNDGFFQGFQCCGKSARQHQFVLPEPKPGGHVCEQLSPQTFLQGPLQ